MAKTVLRLTETDLTNLVNSMVNKMLRETIEDVEIEVTPGDIAQAIIDEAGGDKPVSPEGKDCFELMEIGDSVAEVTFTYSVNIYVTPGHEYGYYDLPDDPEVNEVSKPEVDEVFIEVNGEQMEDDGTVADTIQDLFNKGILYVDTSEIDAFPTQDDYYNGGYEDY